MDYFHYQQGELYAEDVPVRDIISQYGTPCYIYSKATLTRHYQVFDQAFDQHPHKIFYAVKANSNLTILNILAHLGSGFDIVSQGELFRVLQAGGTADKIVFSGVGKTHDEIKYALYENIACFHVESIPELMRIQYIAATLNKQAHIAFRVNPNVDALSHPYISTGLQENKFGIPQQEILSAYQIAKQQPNLHIKGIACHIGSQITETAPFTEALQIMLKLVKQLQTNHVPIEYISLGGGLGICYDKETPPTPQDYITQIIEALRGNTMPIYLEPGRAIMGNAGILVTAIEYLKETPTKSFAIVDAGMNDLLRPSLYQSYHQIIPVSRTETKSKIYDVVGPICETGDFLAKERLLEIGSTNLLAIRTAGAYGFTMSSNYNSRPRAAEVVVDGAQYHLVRKRETLSDLTTLESIF